MKIPKKILMATGGSALFLASTMITHFEGLKFKPYFDGGGVLSVCYGHTGKDIVRNRMYTQEDCDKWLNDDLKAVKRYVDPLIKVNINTLTQAAFTHLLITWAWVILPNRPCSKQLNNNDRKGACDEMKRW
ncbi:lysozyme, partial [Candidatus Arsenophonus triatominarum]|uniref:lysozyme n=1 Tax=Candidatus Arsenophonus triatominarum TaxID=57911 RepID=UPI001396BD35